LYLAVILNSVLHCFAGRELILLLLGIYQGGETGEDEASTRHGKFLVVLSTVRGDFA